MLIKDNFYIKFKNNYNKIKIILFLFRIYRHGAGVFNLELINENFINIAYLGKNDISLKIEKNKSNISSNLEKINTNENDISSNLTKIDTNKSNISSNLEKINNISKNKLTNISNDVFFNNDTQVNFSNDSTFFEKEYNISFKKNDFVEIYFTMLLNYVNINYKNYVKSIYKILNDKIVLYDHRNYSSFNNYLTIDEKFFYNFNEDIENIKFTIKFEMTESYVIRLFYNKRNNNRLILKHFGN